MKRTTMILVGCITFGIGGNSMLAQNNPSSSRADVERDGDNPRQDQDNTRAKRHASGHLAHANQVMDMTVRNPQGDAIGSVEDMVIDSQGRVAFFILSFEEDFVSDDQFYAVPPRALRSGSDPDHQDLILSISKEKFTANSGFSSERFPRFNEQFIRDTYERFDQAPYWEGTIQDRRRDQTDRNEPRANPKEGAGRDIRDNQVDPRDNAQDRLNERENVDARTNDNGQLSNADRQRAYNKAPEFDGVYGWTSRASEVIGKQVVNDNNESLGRIKDLVFDASQCRVLYAILTDGGVLNLGETFTPVPYSALTATGDKEYFILDATMASLAPISFQESAWPDLGNRQWAQRVHTQFKQDSYWAMNRDDDAQSRNVDKSWRQDSDYNKHYNTQRPKTIMGTVTSISEFSPEDGAAMGRQIMVRTEDGKTSTVHLGPSSYMKLQDSTFAIKEGDEVTITGSACRFNDKDILMASQIRNDDGKTLDLRDRAGQPKWDSQDKEHRQHDRQNDRQENRAENRTDKPVQPKP